MALSRNVWCWVLIIFDDDDYDWAGRGQSHMGRHRPGPLCQSLSHPVHVVETRGSVGEDDTPYLAQLILLAWSRIELEALASGVQPPGVSPLTLGSSGTLVK